MNKWKIRKSKQQGFLLFVFNRTMIILISVGLCLESSGAIAGNHTVETAQTAQTNSADTTRTAEEAYQAGKTLYQQGTAESLQQAIVFFEKALSLYQKLGDRTSEAFALAHLGKIYSDLGNPRKALDYLHPALLLRQQIGDKTGETITLNNIGNVYSNVGELQKALEHFQKALLIKQKIGDQPGEAITLNNIGNVYLELGNLQKSLDYFQQSLTLRRKIGDKLGEARTLNNLGTVYIDLGEQPQALNYLEQALLSYQKIGDKKLEESHILNNIGAVYLNLEKQQKALDYFQQSLTIRRQSQDKLGEARSLNNIGAVYSDLGDKKQALDYFQQALPLFQSLENKLGLAATLNNIGKVYLALGEQQEALQHFQKSLPTYQQVGNRAGEAQTIYHLASVHRHQGDLNSALDQIKIVIKIVEELRTQIHSQELRTSYFATVQDYYQFYIDLLMQLHKQKPSQGYDAQALQASEQARARSLLELLNESKADIHQGTDPQLVTQERNLQQQIDSLEKRRIQLSNNSTDTQIKALETENEALLEQYRQVQAKIRAKSPQYAALTQPQPLSLKQIQSSVLDEDTILLEYSLGEKRSHLWVVSNQKITSYELPKRADIEAAVQNFRQAITTPYLKNSPSINTLSQLILAPAAQQIKNKRLIIVSDGALQYVPFAALNTSNLQESSKYEPLLLHHEIITLPSASTLAILRREHKNRQPALKTLVVLADPIFSSDDERLRRNVEVSRPQSSKSNLDTVALNRAAIDSNISFERLRFTRQEAEGILSLVPTNQSKQAVDFTASRSTAFSQELRQYRIVHFATHGILNSKHPQLSGIVLSLFDEQGRPQNGFLRLHDVFNLNLQAELVVLSACQTGLGKAVRGEGLVGLTRGFMYAGSPRVVVSLWSVDDQATSELMKIFYENMLKKGLTPAAALRAAQTEIWRTQTYAAPYYWAAFTLQGEWK